MGLGQWYDAHIMPRLVTCACSQGQVMKRRAELVPLAEGDVFELGCGGGINQQFYNAPAIDSYAGIDPHEGLLDGAKAPGAREGLACRHSARNRRVDPIPRSLFR